MRRLLRHRLLGRILVLLAISLTAFMVVEGVILGIYNQDRLHKQSALSLSDSIKRLKEGLTLTIPRFDTLSVLSILRQEMSNPAIVALALDNKLLDRLSPREENDIGMIRRADGTFAELSNVAHASLVPERYSEVKTLHIGDGATEVGTLEIYLSNLAYDRAAWELALSLVLQLLGLGSGLYLVLVFALRSAVLSPIESLTASMRQSRQGVRVEVPTSSLKNEIGELSRAFQQMNATIIDYQERLEDIVAVRTRELEQLQKSLAYGSLMAAEIAHEIKTPLGSCNTAFTFIEGEYKTLAEGFAAGTLTKPGMQTFIERFAETSKIIQRNLENAIRLSHSFKEVVVNQLESSIRSFQLKTCIEDIVLSLKPRLRAFGNPVNIDCNPEWAIESDIGAFTQVVINLITNSLVHAFPSPAGPARIEIQVSRDAGGDAYTIRYRDNGKGMSPEVLSRIFEPMFTTKKDQGGTGLGMAIIKDLLEKKLQGSISVWSEEGKGAVFTIALPDLSNREKRGGQNPTPA